ncbi:MAG: T9SS type A sorting domain-containing protein [Saprospiraceae bacterium]|nr:T9SS type A sorting domain-containing protein [Saprospiraceae bacterium]
MNAQCTTPAIAPTLETFGGGATPACWSQSAVVGGPWVFTGNPGYAASGTQSHTADGSHFAWVDFSAPTDDDVVLEMNEVNISALTTPAAIFWFKSDPSGSTASAQNVMRVDAANATGAWTTITTVIQADPDWQMHIIDLTPYVYNTNIVKIRFVADYPGTGTAFYNDLMLDDVAIDEAPTCFSPSNFVGTTTGIGNDVGLSWVANTTTPATNGYTIEYGLAGFTQGTGTIVTTTNVFDTITGLNACTTYDFYLKAECAAGDFSFTAGPVQVLTPPGIVAAPYEQKFFGGATPGCWTQNQTSTIYQWKFSGNPYFLTSVSPAPTSHSADGSHFAWIDMSYTQTPRQMTMPEVNISGLPTAALSFWMWSNASFNANSAQNTLLVQASDGAGGWDTVTVINQDALDWQFKLYDLSSYTYGANNNLVQIRFDGIPQPSTGTILYNDIALDDIKIDALPTAACAPIMAPDTMGFEDAGLLNPCWEQDTTDARNWTIQTGPTGSGGTGPSGANSGMYYAYLESSSPVASGDDAILMSPPINTAMLDDAPAVYFNYHMFGNDSMILRVEYEVFGSDYWTTVWEQVGSVQTAETDPYEEAYIPLPNAIGSIIRLRFIAIAETNNGATPGAGNAWQSDVAIDDIRVQNVLADDVAVTNIITPGNSCGLGVQPVTIEVTNRGFNTQSNVPLFVSVNGGTPVGASITGAIAANGGTATVDVLVDMTALGAYTIDAYTALATDEVPSNNMNDAWAYHQPNVIGQYDESFEGGDGYWYADGAWEHGMPSATVINDAAAGAEAFVTNLSGNYPDAQTSYLYSPCFDLSGMTTPLLRFSVNWDIEDDWDGAWIEYSTSSGATWEKLGANDLSGQNWYTDSITNQPIGWVWNGTGANGSGGWVDAIIDLSSYGVTVVPDTRFRFVMFADAGTNNEGLGIDNFGVFDGCVATVLNETVVDESIDGLADGSITLNPVAGFGGYTFLWSTGATTNSISGLAPGTYDVTVTDQLTCVNTSSFTIVSLCPTSLGLSQIVNPEVGDDENNGSASISATGGTAPYTYAWSNGTTTNAVFNLGGDSLTVTVTDANGCTDMADVIVETVYMVGTENLVGLTGLLLSPNPAKDYAQLNINFNKSVDLTVSVVDVTGRILETRNAGNTMSEEMRFDVSNLAEGVYFMQITADGQTATKRFVVVK